MQYTTSTFLAPWWFYLKYFCYISTNSPYSKKMILYIIKPQQGYGFAAILNPGMVSGETGMNEKGITISENNILIKQTE